MLSPSCDEKDGICPLPRALQRFGGCSWKIRIRLAKSTEADPGGWIFGREVDVEPLFGGHFPVFIPFPSWWSSVSGASPKLRDVLLRKVLEEEEQIPKVWFSLDMGKLSMLASIPLPQLVST